MYSTVISLFFIFMQAVCWDISLNAVDMLWSFFHKFCLQALLKVGLVIDEHSQEW